MMSHIISHYDNSCTKLKTNMQLNMHVWIISSKAYESHPTLHYLMQLPHQPLQSRAINPSTFSKTTSLLYASLHFQLPLRIHQTRKNCSRPKNYQKVLYMTKSQLAQPIKLFSLINGKDLCQCKPLIIIKTILTLSRL